ncbi:uncharacterized protein LOC126843319 isoform X8 [Adelges cooleyi]|uniref:uncharacterized protein LOC126843319 isoform X8 n=1 Tax=Adelges cooleyi TaxID=133065 RepID=UPI00217F68C9|nr:uncharacterized protein LOC126843319 isoform X8 [Adelges cooleyi]
MFILTVILCTALFSSPLDHFTFSAFQKIVKFNNSCKMRKITILFIVAMILATTLGDKDKKASKENKKKLKHLQENGQHGKVPLPYTTPYREEQPVLAYPYDPHKLAYPYAQQVPQYQHAQQVPSYGQVIFFRGDKIFSNNLRSSIICSNQFRNINMPNKFRHMDKIINIIRVMVNINSIHIHYYNSYNNNSCDHYP